MRLLTLTLLAVVTSYAQAASQPNIVFIEVDDLPPHYVGAMGAGFAQTPTLDALAERGVLFRAAVCQGTQCGPSRNSLIAGLYPHNLGMYENGPFAGLPTDIWTLPRALQNAGYHTAHIGKSHIHPSKDGLSGSKSEIRTEGHRRLGFDHVWQSLGRAVIGGNLDPDLGIDSYVDFLIEKGHFQQMKDGRGQPTTLPDDVYLDGLFTTMAVEHIATRTAADQPYFLWLNYSVPHGPYDVKQAYHDRFSPEYMPTPNAADDDGSAVPASLRPHRQKPDKLSADQTGNCANISFLDDQVAAILAAIEASGEGANTIIVFFSDHGILVGDHGLTHKSTLYREVLNPTLIIHDPRSGVSADVERPVELLDIIKTTLDWGGASDADKAAPFGESLLPLLGGAGTYKRTFAAGECPGYFALVSERWKYIAPYDHNPDGAIILFDLAADREETVNVASDHPEVVADFAAKAAAWLAATGPIKQQAPKKNTGKKKKGGKNKS
ncbi:MAG: sulfatase family protein [Planctomycetota bacterium]|jgi:arylsulfatase A-like enzyme